ncbi:MAG TPA: arginyltransferase [Gemmataceae bacterium]|nr:arginyltransferase [Gemmataceae bacterium]
METVARYIAPPSQCGYLPEQFWRLEYEHVATLSPQEYLQRLLQGWRRFGRALFRPRCRTCTACQSLRVVVERFRPDRSQRRCRRLNESEIVLRIGAPSLTRSQLALYDRYHAHQADSKGWPEHPVSDAYSYANSFVDNPFPTQEWRYYFRDRLIGVGYVDDLPGGLSAIYFFYDPEERWRGLGTWNVLSILDRAAAQGIPYVYLGYYVANCPSMTYKNRFRPNQLLGLDGQWIDFRK